LRLIWLFLINLQNLAILKSNSAALTLARIIGRRCLGLLLFRTEVTIYSETMQNIRNETKQLNTCISVASAARDRRWALA